MNRMEKRTAIYQQLKGGLIVSAQALPHEPLYVPERTFMDLMAKAAILGGAVGLRLESARDIAAVRKITDLPLIGLIKREVPGFASYITPTMQEVDQIVEAGADIVALDCTLRPRGDGLSVTQYLEQIRQKYPDVLLMADIATFEDGVHAAEFGVDFIGTTLSGYTETSEKREEPDYELVARLSQVTDIPLIGEGRVHYPAQAREFLDRGAFAVVVGGAITRPLEITKRFVAAVQK